MITGSADHNTAYLRGSTNDVENIMSSMPIFDFDHLAPKMLPMAFMPCSVESMPRSSYHSGPGIKRDRNRT